MSAAQRILLTIGSTVALACSSSDVVVFKSDNGDGGGGDTSADMTATSGAADAGTDGGTDGDAVEGDCASSDECAPGWYCSKPTCRSSRGCCAPPPAFCEPDPSPVCGCNGATYWNDCVRRQFGVQSASPGECQATAARCTGDPFTGANDCEIPGAFCAHLFAGGCPDEYPGPDSGTCWVVPFNCVDSLPPRWLLCPPPGYPPLPGLACADTCLAIRSQFRHVLVRDQRYCD